jgi:argininosuccinate lyase
LDDFRSADPSLGAALDKSVYDVLGVEKAVQAFASFGSTAPAEVRKQIEVWKQKVK